MATSTWPTWLGDNLQPDSASHWRAEASESEVNFVPLRSLPKILVIVSRKASSYDTALKTLLGVYSRELPQTQWLVKKLPSSPVGLTAMLIEAEEQVDLVYTVGSKATVAVHNIYQGGLLPVVSVNAKDPVQLGLIENYQGSGNNFAFTSLNLPADVNLSFMKRFKPSLEQIGILYAKSNKSAYLTQYLPMKQLAEEAGLTVVPIVVDESEPSQRLNAAMQLSMAHLKKADPKLDNTLLWLTGSSSLLARVAEINRYSERLPLISAVPDVVRSSSDSALMSFGVSFVNNAHQAALYGLRILKAETMAGELPVGIIAPPDIAISFQQAKRIDQQIPFVLMEMASDVYGIDGKIIRSEGKPVRENQ
ncbi:ABC transporter substrate-binding protein [uncultured Photobacterium sp.]|uniref:ABC transporter substrate-binding protein n=1 Tax=uncultured Photobacterium sp. TaxID=173973 RepID=UPI00345D0F8E